MGRAKKRDRAKCKHRNKQVGTTADDAAAAAAAGDATSTACRPNAAAVAARSVVRCRLL